LVNAVNSYFVGIFQDLSPIDFLGLLTDAELSADFVIKAYEVADRISKLNIYKALGPGGLPTWLCNNVCHI